MSGDETTPQWLQRPDGNKIAYHRSPGNGPGVVFLGGYASDMTGTKATFLNDWCAERGRTFLRFDYLGHGRSTGSFADGTIGRWAEDALAVIDAATEGPLVLVGSSMGGWIMLLVAKARARRLAGMVGVAAAPDFTRQMMERELTEDQRAALLRDGIVYLPSAYSDEPTPLTLAFIEDGNRNAVLDAPIAVDCPVRLLQGMRDPDVPWEWALRVADGIAAEDVEITLVKAGDHRLSEPDDIQRLLRAVKEVCARA